MTCGMVCCGKSTYAKKIQAEQNAVILSIDDITLTLFPEGSGEMHDTYALRAEQYLLNLSIQILLAGVDVILDWGLWTKAMRNRIRRFYGSEGIKTELHYLRISPWIKTVFIILISVSILNGVCGVIIAGMNKPVWNRHRLVTGMVLSVAGVGVFIGTRQPYAGIVCFAILVIKAWLTKKH